MTATVFEVGRLVYRYKINRRAPQPGGCVDGLGLPETFAFTVDRTIADFAEHERSHLVAAAPLTPSRRLLSATCPSGGHDSSAVPGDVTAANGSTGGGSSLAAIEYAPIQ